MEQWASLTTMAPTFTSSASIPSIASLSGVNSFTGREQAGNKSQVHQQILLRKTFLQVRFAF